MEKKMEKEFKHTPVLLNECLDGLNIKPEGIYVDGTLGGGGHSGEILKRLTTGKLIAFDKDDDALSTTKEKLKGFGDKIIYVKSDFKNMYDVVTGMGIDKVDGILLDLGVSSYQIDTAERGFSYRFDGFLDMRMDRNGDLTAYDVVNDYDEKNIADIIYNFGEEVKSRAIAKKIIEYRKNKAIETTTELADIVRSCFPNKYTKIDFATKTFQAIRIFVNDELKELETILNDSVKLLKSGGRLVVVSFHSLEDRIVKDFLNDNGDCKLLKVNKYKEVQKETLFKVLTKKPVIVSSVEVDKNRRARSAKLRGAVRC